MDVDSWRLLSISSQQSVPFPSLLNLCHLWFTSLFYLLSFRLFSFKLWMVDYFILMDHPLIRRLREASSSQSVDGQFLFHSLFSFIYFLFHLLFTVLFLSLTLFSFSFSLFISFPLLGILSFSFLFLNFSWREGQFHNQLFPFIISFL